LKLYSYWRSSASWRVRIGLELKGLAYEYVPVHLVQDGGQQHAGAHHERNPMNQVPVLEIGDLQLTQSLAILEYLDETYPGAPLLPEGAVGRARARQLAEVVNSGIQPLQNLHVLQKIGAEGGDKGAWGKYFIQRGLDALEAMAGDTPFLAGDEPSIADICLVPQLYNARRFQCDLDTWPKLLAIEARCEALPAFQAAHPDQQPDAF